MEYVQTLYQQLLNMEWSDYLDIILVAVLIYKLLPMIRSSGAVKVAVVIGAILYYVVIALVIQLGLNTDDLKLFSAAFVALALFIPYWKDYHGGKSLIKGGKNHA